MWLKRLIIIHSLIPEIKCQSQVQEKINDVVVVWLALHSIIFAGISKDKRSWEERDSEIPKIILTIVVVQAINNPCS